MSEPCVPPCPTPSSSPRLASAKLSPAVDRVPPGVARKVTQTLTPEAIVEEIELNSASGLIAMAGGRTIVAIMIDMDGERIHSIFALCNPDKLRAIGVTHPVES